MRRVLYGNRIGREGKVTVVCSAAIFDEKNEKILLMKVKAIDWQRTADGFANQEAV